MTVRELIEKLKEMPADMPVTMTDYFDDERDVSVVRVMRQEWVEHYDPADGDWREATLNEQNNPDVQFRSAVNLGWGSVETGVTS